PRAQRNVGAGLLAEHRIGHRHDRRLLYLRMRIEQRLDVRRIELHAAAIDDVLAAPGDGVVAPALLGEIAGAEPAIGAERRASRLAVLVVAAERERPAHLQLAVGGDAKLGARTR